MVTNKFIKIIVSVFIMLTLIFSYPMDNHASTSEVIKIGYYENYGTLLESFNQGKMGYGYEYFFEIAKYTNWKYEYIPCEWSEGLEMLENGEIDIFGPMQITDQRKELFDFTDIEFGYEYGVLYADKDSDICFDDIERFDGMKVGIESDIYFIDKMDEYCKENGINVQYVKANAKTVEEDLKAGKYEVFVSGSLHAVDNTKIVAKISTDPFYYAVKKGNTNLLTQLNNTLDKIKQNDTYFAAHLDDKYFGGKSISKPNFTKEEKELTEKYNKLTVGIDKNMEPIQYYDKETDEAAGIAVDILKKIGEECGIIFEFVPIKYNLPMTRILTAEETKEKSSNRDRPVPIEKYDLMAGYRNGNARESRLKTAPYLEVSMMFVGTKTKNIKDAKTLGMIEVDTVSMEEVKEKYPEFEIIPYKTKEELIEALNSKHVDLILITIYSYNDVVRSSNQSNYIAINAELKFPMSIGVSEELPMEMVTILNKGISRLEQDDINTISFSNTVKMNGKVSFMQFIRDNAIVIILLVTIVLLIMFVLVIAIIKTSKSKRNMLQKIAYVDPVTGYPTLLKFRQDIEEILKTGSPGEYMLVALDIDNFKYINDIYGFDIGNQVLKIVAQKIEEDCQAIQDNTILKTRMHADHFVLFFKNIEKKNILMDNGSDDFILSKMETLLGESYHLQFSLGAYVIEDLHKDLSIMIDYANIAKKSVKGVYGNCVAQYSNAMNEKFTGQREITLAMDKALKRKEFIPYLQPKVLFSTERTVGAEMLVRWISPEKGMILPNDFIPLFEKNGFIQKLDFYMFRNTCELLSEWNEKHVTEIPRISVNISKVTLVSKLFAESILAITKEYQVETKYIEIELTESTISESVEEILNIMSNLKQMGFCVSIDDFGSGYSSLNLLKDIQADVLKIDKEFLSSTIQSQKGKLILSSVINMSKGLELETVAEGVETKEQVDCLKQMGCDIAQGYYYAKPMPIKEFEEKYIP